MAEVRQAPRREQGQRANRHDKRALRRASIFTGLLLTALRLLCSLCLICAAGSRRGTHAA